MLVCLLFGQHQMNTNQEGEGFQRFLKLLTFEMRSVRFSLDLSLF